MSKITVVRVNKTVAPKGYEIVELVYKTDEGKVKQMKMFGFLKKDLFAVAANSKQGDVLEASFQQSDKGYWEFGSLKATGETTTLDVSNPSTVGSATLGGVSGSTKGNWETSEERANRQVLIVRQSSLSNAVAYFEAAKQKPSVEDVVSVATQFETYVLGKPSKIQQTGEIV